MLASCAKQPIVCSFHAGKLCKRSFQSLGEFREENKFSTWLIRITVSQSLMKLGNQRQWRRLWLGCRRCIFGEIVTAGGAWRLQGARSLVSFRGSAVS